MGNTPQTSGKLGSIPRSNPFRPLEISMLTNIELTDNGDVWILSWFKDEEYYSRVLYANNTVEKAIQDSLNYFGGLVNREDIRVS